MSKEGLETTGMWMWLVTRICVTYKRYRERTESDWLGRSGSCVRHALRAFLSQKGASMTSQASKTSSHLIGCDFRNVMPRFYWFKGTISLPYVHIYADCPYFYHTNNTACIYILFAFHAYKMAFWKEVSGDSVYQILLHLVIIGKMTLNIQIEWFSSVITIAIINQRRNDGMRMKLQNQGCDHSWLPCQH